MHSFDAPKFWTSKTVTYNEWLSKKVAAHFERDNKRNILSEEVTRTVYKEAIHSAVLRCQGVDYYTGETLDWNLVGTFNNDEAVKTKVNGGNYKEIFHTLPSVDHNFDNEDKAFNAKEYKSHQIRFEICSWRTNDAKNDLDLPRFLALCKAVLLKQGYSVTPPNHSQTHL